MKTKRVEYSYPTSVHATEFGFGKSGCYTVHVVARTPNREKSFPVAAFASLELARTFGETMPEPWDRITK